MLQNQGSIQWEAARQLAYSNATEGKAEPNVDPAIRFKVAELGRVAELHVQQATGLDTAVGGRTIEVVPVNRTAFTSHTLDAYRPLFETLAGSLGQTPTITAMGGLEPFESEDLPGDPDDPTPAWPCSASSWGSWRRPCSAWPSARWWAGWPAGPSGSTTSRSRGHRPARSRSCPGPSRSSPATGASRRRRSCSGSASTRSPRTPCSASLTSGPSWSSSCATTPAGSVPTPAPSASGSGPSTSAAPTPSASCSSSSAIPRSCWAPSARPSRSACAPGWTR